MTSNHQHSSEDISRHIEDNFSSFTEFEMVDIPASQCSISFPLVCRIAYILFKEMFLCAKLLYKENSKTKKVDFLINGLF